MTTTETLRGTSAAAREVPCAEATLRNLDQLLKPIRDSAGRRLYTGANIQLARDHLLRAKNRPVI